MLVFHLATASDWAAAQASGRYTTSTHGRTLAEEGFIHASRADQWQAVRRRWYAGVTEPLVLLVVDTDLLEAPVLEEAVAGSTETFPHVYGVLETTAVVRVVALDDAGATSGSAPSPPPGSPAPPPAVPVEPAESFSRVYLREVYRSALVAASVMAVVVVGALLAGYLLPGWSVLGALIGLVLGVVLARRGSGRAGS